MSKTVPALADVVADLAKELGRPLSPSEKRWIDTLFQPLLDDLPTLPRDKREQPARYGIAVEYAMQFLAKYRDVERLKAEGADPFLATMELGGMLVFAKIALGLLPAIQAGKNVASGGARGARERHGDTDANYDVPWRGERSGSPQARSQCANDQASKTPPLILEEAPIRQTSP
jgi:hypothetical protein